MEKGRYKKMEKISVGKYENIDIICELKEDDSVKDIVFRYLPIEIQEEIIEVYETSKRLPDAFYEISRKDYLRAS